MIETYKILSNKYDPSVCTGLFEMSQTTTRGHHLKIAKQQANTNIKKHFFTHRIVNAWNKLPQAVVDSPNIVTFESRLDKHWSNHPTTYCHTDTA